MSSFLTNLRHKFVSSYIYKRFQFVDLYLLASCILPALSLIPYLIFPKETLYFMNGDKNPCGTAIAWVPIAGSGDALQAFVNGWAFLSKKGDIKRMVVIGNGIYGVIHFGSFIRAHFEYKLSNIPLLVLYISSIVALFVVVLLWGVIRPPKDVIVEEKNQDVGNMSGTEGIELSIVYFTL